MIHRHPLGFAIFIFILGIASLFFIVTLYIQKTWDKARNILTDLLPGLEDLDEQDADSLHTDDVMIKSTGVSQNVGNIMNTMFMRINDEIVDAKCDIENIISPKGLPFC